MGSVLAIGTDLPELLVNREPAAAARSRLGAASKGHAGLSIGNVTAATSSICWFPSASAP